ncbi:hypothetical protein B0A49_10724 [Cryomyces minteri]|uniref:LRAT domain-containing protein n=1 Tax=Cryomyces minteri TaxID=331657 RepID=A0A4U0W675_9PEZI|nr:hypothetical protein B0A49_10724 [Cryomyces minteri]
MPAEPSPPQATDMEPDADETGRHACRVPVFLITINLERLENSYNHSAPFRRHFFPRNIRIIKHWAILVRNTVYELARDESAAPASGVKLSTSQWDEVQTRFDPPERCGTTSLSDAEIREIAESRFPKWPKHGYSVTYSNCQCFCYRFTWYICDETRFRSGKLDSKHLPLRLAKVQAYVLVTTVFVLGTAWAVWVRTIWWPPKWDTPVAVAYEAFLFFMARVFFKDADALGGWHGTEHIACEFKLQRNTHFLGPGGLFRFAYGPSFDHQFVKAIWQTLSTANSASPRNTSDKGVCIGEREDNPISDLAMRLIREQDLRTVNQ